MLPPPKCTKLRPSSTQIQILLVAVLFFFTPLYCYYIVKPKSILLTALLILEILQKTTTRETHFIVYLFSGPTVFPPNLSFIANKLQSKQTSTTFKYYLLLNLASLQHNPAAI